MKIPMPEGAQSAIDESMRTLKRMEQLLVEIRDLLKEQAK